MANEIHESFSKVEAPQTNTVSLSDYAMVRQSGQLAQSDLRSNDALVGNGMLPAFELADSAVQHTAFKAPPPLKGTDITTKDMKDAGVSAAQEKDGDTKTTNARYPGGIEVSVSNGKTITTPDGHEITISNSNLVQVKPPIHESKEGSGVFVDKAGKVVAKVNDDGTVTVDTGDDGGFYKQTPEGVKKVAAIRSRDKKTWDEIDTDNPISNDMRKDMDQPRK